MLLEEAGDKLDSSIDDVPESQEYEGGREGI
jgi:hypothetical protein